MTSELMMKDMTKAELRVARYLKRQLFDLPPGAALPTVRSIVQACSAGQHTIQGVFHKFCELGLLETRWGQGVFRGETPLLPSDMRVLVYSEEPFAHRRTGFRDELVAAVCEELAQRGWDHLVQIATDLGGDLRLQAEIEGKTVDAAVLVGAESPGLGSGLEALEIPAIHLIPATAEMPKPAIAVAPDPVVETQIAYLLSKGRRRIAYLHPLEPGHMHRDFLFRREAFYRLVAEKGLPHHPGWVRYAGGDDAETVGVVREIMSGDEPPSGMILHDEQAPSVYRALRELNIEPERDVCLVGTDNLSLAEEVEPPLTTVDVSRRELARAGAHALDELLHNRAVDDLQWLPAKLIPR
ncbi:MAG: substrate-binding domain-containing protein [bacterium]